MDWERQNFSISACVFSENSQQNLVAIASASSSSGSGSSTVGIAVGVTVGVVVLIAAAIAAFFVIRRRKRRQTGANAKGREDPSEKIRQGFAKGELDTGHDNQRYEMAGSDPSQTKKTDDNDIPGWVNEKANYPGDRAGMVEADGGDGSARAELGGPMAPRNTVRPLHEMHDPHSQPTFELPADTPGELQGSTPGSSMPGSPVSSMRRSAGRLSGAGGSRSPFSKPTSPLSAQSGSPHPSPVDHRLDQPSTSAGPSSGPSRSSFLGFSRLGGNRSSPASGPSSEYSRRQAPQHPGQPSDSDGPMTPSSPHVPGRSSNMAPSRSNEGREAFSPAVSRRGTFERSGTPSAPYPANDPNISSPISPQSPETRQQQHQGLWGRLRRS